MSASHISEIGSGVARLLLMLFVYRRALSIRPAQARLDNSQDT